MAGAGRCAAIIVNALDTSPDWSAQLAALGFSVVELDLRSFFGAPDKLETFLGGIGLVWINDGNALIAQRRD